jgi:hypothetical protein
VSSGEITNAQLDPTVEKIKTLKAQLEDAPAAS